MKNRNWFWGFFFLASAVFVIATQLGSFGEIGILSIMGTVLLAAIIIASIFDLNYFGIFVPVSFLYMIYQKPLDLPEISPWLLILTAVLVSIGFHILFRSKPKKCHSFCQENHFTQSGENLDGDNVYAKVSFGSSSKYLHSESLKSGQFYVSFGALQVYFDQAQLSPEGAEIFLDCSFGAIELFVPGHWNVRDSLHASLGGVENNRRIARVDENAPKLTLTGNVHLGGVEIHYI